MNLSHNITAKNEFDNQLKRLDKSINLNEGFICTQVYHRCSSIVMKFFAQKIIILVTFIQVKIVLSMIVPDDQRLLVNKKLTSTGRQMKSQQINESTERQLSQVSVDYSQQIIVIDDNVKVHLRKIQSSERNKRDARGGGTGRAGGGRAGGSKAGGIRSGASGGMAPGHRGSRPSSASTLKLRPFKVLLITIILNVISIGKFKD